MGKLLVYVLMLMGIVGLVIHLMDWLFGRRLREQEIWRVRQQFCDETRMVCHWFSVKHFFEDPSEKLIKRPDSWGMLAVTDARLLYWIYEQNKYTLLLDLDLLSCHVVYVGNRDKFTDAPAFALLVTDQGRHYFTATRFRRFGGSKEQTRKLVESIKQKQAEEALRNKGGLARI